MDRQDEGWPTIADVYEAVKGLDKRMDRIEGQSDRINAVEKTAQAADERSKDNQSTIESWRWYWRVVFGAGIASLLSWIAGVFK